MLETVKTFIKAAEAAEKAGPESIIGFHLELSKLLKPAIEEMRQFVHYEFGHTVSEAAAKKERG